MSVEVHSIKIGINRCYLVRDRGVIMIDAGYKGRGRKMIRKIKRSGIAPEMVKLIVLTHGDFDHAGGAGALREMTGAKIAIHEKDRLLLEEGRFNWPGGVTLFGKISHFLFAPLMRGMKARPTKADIILGDEELDLRSFGIDGRILYTPGHTSGSVSVVLDSGEAFVGCMAHVLPFRLRPGLPIYAENIGQIKENWKKIISQGAKTIYPGHGKAFPVEVIIKKIEIEER